MRQLLTDKLALAVDVGVGGGGGGSSSVRRPAAEVRAHGGDGGIPLPRELSVLLRELSNSGQAERTIVTRCFQLSLEFSNFCDEILGGAHSSLKLRRPRCRCGYGLYVNVRGTTGPWVIISTMRDGFRS